jgi:Fe-S-cluster containining protein
MGGGVVKEDQLSDMNSARGAIHQCGKKSFLPDNKGSCALLKGNLCTVYDDRPRGCREYPWYNIGGKLYYDKGCPGIRSGLDERPPVDSIAQINAYFPYSIWLQRFLIFAFRVW